MSIESSVTAGSPNRTNTSTAPYQPTMNFPLEAYFMAAMRWLWGVFTTILWLLQFPISLMIAGYVLIWLFNFLLPAAIPAICILPFSVHLQGCQQTRPPPDPRLIQDGLNYGAKLEEMQIIGASSVELPYYLRIGEDSVRQ